MAWNNYGAYTTYRNVQSPNLTLDVVNKCYEKEHHFFSDSTGSMYIMILPSVEGGAAFASSSCFQSAGYWKVLATDDENEFKVMIDAYLGKFYGVYNK